MPVPVLKLIKHVLIFHDLGRTRVRRAEEGRTKFPQRNVLGSS